MEQLVLKVTSDIMLVVEEVQVVQVLNQEDLVEEAQEQEVDQMVVTEQLTLEVVVEAQIAQVIQDEVATVVQG